MMHDTRYSPLDSAEIVSAPPPPKGDDDDGWTAIMPVPDGIGYWPADGRGKPADKVWRYLDPEERLLVILAR